MATKKSTKSTGIPMIKDSAREIWLAGLGAFSVANEEGGKVFKQLVKKGAVLEKENKVRLAELGERANELKDDAKGAMKNLSAPIEAGIAGAMQKLGVPTRTEIMNLTKRVEELTKAVAKAKTEAKPTPAAKKPAAKKPAAKAKSAGSQG
ncbi:MAG: phasin family protein [Holophagaceae bacterium]|nr:phasin family protein [Holophagaceae bacterium]